MSAAAELEPLDTARPFSRQQALAAGISLSALRSRAYRRIFNGVYVDAAIRVTPAIRAAAALVPFDPRAFASHSSAARLLGLPIPTMPDEHVTVSAKHHRRPRPGIVCHVLPEASLVVVGGVRTSAPEQAFVELASLLSLVDLVVVGDAVLRRKLTTVEKLRRFCLESKLPGAAQARAAVAFVRERVDSPMETRLRMLIVLAGLPEPVVNMTVADGAGVRRYDLCWPDCRLIVEYDGRQHAEDADQWASDVDRREAIDDTGWRILIVTAKGIYTHPERTLENIARVLRARGHGGVPSRLADAWRPHFPGRA